MRFKKEITSFNRKTLKRYKRKLICITYKVKKNPDVNSIVGRITALTDFHILFLLGQEDKEIFLSYDQIQKIEYPQKETPPAKYRGEKVN